jgi:Flp pilus assembly protein TadD
MSIMGPERARLLGLALLSLLILSTLALILLPAFKREDIRLESVTPLLAAGRFDEAERTVDRFLRLHPTSTQAHVLLAQIVLNKEKPQPRRALDALSSVFGLDPPRLAQLRVLEGRAYSALERNDLAEKAWTDALRLDSRVPEAGWNLLGLYFVQGRRSDAHRLAMKLRDSEPDPGDRAQLLLELVRQDAQPLSPDSLIRTLEPIVNGHPEDLHSANALGLAFVRNGRTSEGLTALKANLQRAPDEPDCWTSLLTALDEAGEPAELAATLEKLPPRFNKDPRFEQFRATVAQRRQDWTEAVDRYLRAWRYDPADFQVLYCLSRVLRAAGRLEEVRAFDLRVRDARAARDQILELYKEANAVKTLGTRPHQDLYHRLADLRERMGRDDEALEWHRLVLKDDAEEQTSRAAERRLMQAIAHRAEVSRDEPQPGGT